MEWESNCTHVAVYMMDTPYEVVGEAYVALLSGPLELTMLQRQVAHDVHRYMADHDSLFSRKTAVVIEIMPACIDDDSLLQDVRMTLSGQPLHRLLVWSLETDTWKE
jgi:hypothetical protein